MLHKTIARLIAFSRGQQSTSECYPERDDKRDDTWIVQPLATDFSSIPGLVR